MKRLIIILIALTTCNNINAQTENPDYDHKLAETMGADDYGMKTYFFVMLKTGTAVIENRQLRDSLFAGHLSNISRMEEEGKLVVAGPLGDNEKSYRGIYIFNVPSRKEVEELLITDPAISSKLLDAELYEWYGSAALGEYLKVHKKIAKILF
jgi:uncharacterized protein YciI